MTPTLPEQNIRIVAADPITVGKHRLLPSVLVNATKWAIPRVGTFGAVRVRPISIVVETPTETQWMEIPNTTSNTLSVMAFMAAAIALVSVVAIGLTQLMQRGVD